MSNMSPTTAALILKLIDLLALGVAMAPQIRAKYIETKAKIDQMVAEGRDPTPDEHAEVDAAIASLTEAFMRPIA